MKVGLLLWPNTDLDIRASGGNETNALITLEVLKKRGFEARLFAKDVIGYREGVRSLKSILFDVNYIYYLKFIIINWNSDVLMGFNTYKIALAYPQKTIVYFGNRFILHHYENETMRNRYKKVNFFFVSKYLLREFVKKHPEIPIGKCMVLYPGVDTNYFAPPVNHKQDDCKKILFASQWVKEKGIFTLIKAAQILESKRKDFRVLLAGGAYLWKSKYLLDKQIRIEKIVKHITKNLKNVEIIGTVPHDEMPELLRSADIYVLPTADEAFGISNIEAMACGLPVVACRVGGVPEAVINNETGLLLEPGDPGALADAIEYLLDNKSVALEMGKKGRKRVEDMFSLDMYEKNLLKIMNEISNA